MGLDTVIFRTKKLSDVLEEIYNNSKTKDSQINTLIQQLQPLIETTGDAMLVVPLIKQYLELSVKNDEQLVKVASIVQRIESKSDAEDFFDPIELAKILENSKETVPELPVKDDIQLPLIEQTVDIKK